VLGRYVLLNNCKHDLVFTQYKDGIKVLLPEKKHFKESFDSFYAKNSLSQLMSHPFNFYFNDHESRLLTYNDETAKQMRFCSLSDGIGKTMFDISPADNAHNIVRTDREVIRSQIQKIVDDEVFFFKKNSKIKQSYLSIKMPFYDKDDQLCGLFGCSVNLEQHSSAAFLSFILESGIVRKQKNSPKNLTIMQKKCSEFLLKGLTAKAIGCELNISTRTVETHINKIKDKFSCRNKTELILKLNNFSL